MGIYKINVVHGHKCWVLCVYSRTVTVQQTDNEGLIVWSDHLCYSSMKRNGDTWKRDRIKWQKLDQMRTMRKTVRQVGWGGRMGWRKFSIHLLDAGVVNEAGICTGASNDDLGPEQLGRHLQLVVVYESCCRLERERGQEGRIKSKWRNTVITQRERGRGKIGTREWKMSKDQ